MNNNDNVDKSQAQPVIDMRDTGRRAALFKRIRRDHSLEIAEDYIELISDLIETTGEARAVDLASNLGVSKPTVNATIQRLQKDGYVDSKPYRAIFLTQKGKELADYYRDAACFVFPSMTDTFGIVVIEALSCGVPVAAYPVTGPLDIIEDGITGSLDNDLKTAIDKALEIKRENCTRSSKKYTWRNVTEQFLSTLICSKKAHLEEDNLKFFS